jgi:hypothetical protein
MSRNRMKNSQSLHWMGVTKWILIVSLLAGLGLCYMLCKNQNLHLAEERNHLQRQLSEIESRNEVLEADLASMKSPKSLERRLLVMRSSLVPWSDPRATWLQWQENTRAHLVQTGTLPRTSLNIDSVPVAASTINATPSH